MRIFQCRLEKKNMTCNRRERGFRTVVQGVNGSVVVKKKTTKGTKKMDIGKGEQQRGDKIKISEYTFNCSD